MSNFKKFFEANPVFTTEEFKEAFLDGRSLHTLHTQLKRYAKSGYIKAIRRGTYFVKGPAGRATAPDEYLVASKLAEDAVLAYHTAFDVLGFAHSLYYRIYYLTKKRRSPMTLESLEIIPLPQPVELARRSREMFGVEKWNVSERKFSSLARNERWLIVSIIPNMPAASKSSIAVRKKCLISIMIRFSTISSCGPARRSLQK
jgi:predicted transcriptional regulator of viral defense system